MQKPLEESFEGIEEIEQDIRPSETRQTILRSKKGKCEYRINQNEIEDSTTSEQAKNSNSLFDSIALDLDTNKTESRKIKKFHSQLHVLGEDIDNYNDLLNSLNHSNILKHHELILDEESKQETNLNLVMENWDFTLFTFLLKEKPSSKNLIKYIKQMVSGLQYLHSKNILHLNLCCENLLIKSETIKISQFGLSKFFSNGFNPLYTAPEVLIGKCPSFASDIFSLAITIFYMYYKITPLEIFNRETSKSLENYEFIVSEIERAEKENFDFFANNDQMPPRIKNIVKKGLNTNENFRGQLQEIMIELEKV